MRALRQDPVQKVVLRNRLQAWTRSGFLLLALARCNGCCRDDACRRVRSVEVLPKEVFTTPGVKLQVLARARDAAGVLVEPTPSAKWQGSAVFDPPSPPNPAVVSVATVGAHAVKAKIGKYWSPQSMIRATPGGLEGTGDMVELEHLPKEMAADVLIDAKAYGDADCAKANDRWYTIAGKAVLPQNFIDGCLNEIAVFAHGHAPLIEALAPNTWTMSFEALHRLSLPNIIPVATDVWYFVDAEDPIPRATWDLEYANWAHAYNQAGIRLDPITHHLMGRSEVYVGDENCTGIETELQFNPDPSHLHVVYVSEIGWLSGPYGWSCPADPARGDIVIISWGRPLATVVTHEVVHRMGNSNPPFPFSTSGHVDTYAGFDGTNLMWTHDDPLANEDRFTLTLGQIFRVHGATHSWVNRGKLRPPGSTQKPCQGDPFLGTCPQLSLRGWIP